MRLKATCTSIDPSILARLVGHDGVRFRRLALKFIDTSRAALAGMRDARQGADLAQLGRHAHRLKSAAATVGALGLAGLCGDLEAACRANSGQVAEQLLGTLGSALDTVNQELTMRCEP